MHVSCKLPVFKLLWPTIGCRRELWEQKVDWGLEFFKSSVHSANKLSNRNLLVYGSGRVVQRCHVSYVTGASNWYWLTVGQGLLSLKQVRAEGGSFISSVSSLSFLFLFLPCPSLLSPLLSLLSLSSLSLGDNTKWATRVDVSLNQNTIN